MQNTSARTILCVAVWLCAGALGANAQEPAAPLDEIVVTGEFAGPGMWQVTRPDVSGGHVLWIVGEPPPLPKRLSWRSRAVEAVVMRSQEVLRDASVKMQPDEKIGVFRGLSMLPAALKARKNPGDAQLKDLLPPDVYARWLVQKQRFLGRDSGIEEWRPLFVANKLRKAAYRELELRDSGMVWDTVEKLVKGLARKNAIRVTQPELEFKFKASEIKDKLKEFRHESLPDVACLEASIALTEALSDRATEEARARAWATADLAGLEALPPLPNVGIPCITAVMSSTAAKEIIPADIREQVYELWIAAAERALAANETTIAIVPLDKLLKGGGYLARLEAKGYSVVSPR
jgi:hypothetical protein